MKLIDLIQKRKSVRRYSSRKVEKEKLEACLEAARLAPSACNVQPWHFIVVDDPDLKDSIAREAYMDLINLNKFASLAPVIIVIVIDKEDLVTTLAALITQRIYPFIDIGIAAEHFCLQAAELGLGTCMLGWFNERNIKKLLHIPRQKKIGLMITVGYPESDELTPKKRKALSEIVTFNHY